MIHFIRPLWLFAYIPALIYFVYVMHQAFRYNPWQQICDPHLLPALIQKTPRLSQRFFQITLLTLILIAIFALAGPAWQQTKLPVLKEVNSRLLVLDVSSVMQVNDLYPDRLSRAKFKIKDLILASKNTQMGLIAFSGEAFVASPLSQDANTLTALLDELHPQMMPTMGSNIAEGLKEALTLIKQTALPSDVLLITASEPTSESWEAARAIRQSGNRLSIFAVLQANANTQQTIHTLQALAKMGGGNCYLFTPNDADIQQIVRQTSVKQVIHDQNLKNTTLWQDAGPWFCLLLLPLAVLVLREKAT